MPVAGLQHQPRQAFVARQRFDPLDDLDADPAGRDAKAACTCA